MLVCAALPSTRTLICTMVAAWQLSTARSRPWSMSPQLCSGHMMTSATTRTEPLSDSVMKEGPASTVTEDGLMPNASMMGVSSA